MADNWQPTLGALWQDGRPCRFCVWAPQAQRVEVHLVSPSERLIEMQRGEQGYFEALVEHVTPGSTYFFRLDGTTDRPDPASRYQPQDVHGPSQVVDPRFAWDDYRWFGLPLQETIFYELHVGTFTPEGTFTAVIPHLDELVALGITALEIMPVAQFPGNRNWGYDGVLPYAVQNSYGGPEGLKALVNACHQHGIAVVLDVVYNHLGAEGNYLHSYGPYFTERYHTPWGAAINFDGPYSDEVRRYFIENALYWITEFHVDGLRLDATHAMLDFSANTFLEELVKAVHAQGERLNRRIYLIAENDRSDDRLLRSPEVGGYGMDAQWSDELHHALHTLLTEEQFGYYQDYGSFSQLSQVFRQGFLYSGEYSPFRKRRHGTFAPDLPAYRFVVCTQNHDQVGNRMRGDRLSALVSFDELKLAAGIVLLSPFLPLLFMGEEYGETAPFLYFTSHTDPDLAQAVSKGRKEEFKEYEWEGEAPDPQDEQTFLQSRLDHRLRDEGQHRVLLDFYTELIRLRKTIPALRHLNKEQMDVTSFERERVLVVRRWADGNEVLVAFSFNDSLVSLTLPIPEGGWSKCLDSADGRWLGLSNRVPAQLPAQGSISIDLHPNSFVVFTKDGS